jgi:lysophospholipase L1-like esterase
MYRRSFLLSGAHGLALSALGGLVSTGALPQAEGAVRPVPLPTAPMRVLFLGDSITYSGGYIEALEAAFRCHLGEKAPLLLNLGLSSETCSGLSEEGHAGGQFPRPDVHERLQRVLDQVRPNLVLACYGMNCGIYHPLSDERFAAYQKGRADIQGAATLIGADTVHLTPPPFDPEPIRARTLPAGERSYPQPYVGYDEVLTRYSEWLLDQRKQGWQVIDLHGPLSRSLAAMRAKDPAARLANDGVHQSAEGHWLMAQAILRHWNVPGADAVSLEALMATHGGAPALKLIRARHTLLRDAWLTATRHTRPGVRAGLPLTEAEPRAAALEAEIQAAMK